MRILVLGSTGFVGRNVAEYFAARGHEVEGACKNPASSTYDVGKMKWHFGDLCYPNAVDYTGFDVVIQCAAATTGCKDTLNDPAMHIPTNAVMNSYIFKEATKAGVKHVVFPSCSVMYQSSDVPLKETDFDANIPLNPAYLGFASTKLYCEKLCEFYAGISNAKFTVFRNSNFFGKYDKYDLNRSHFLGATITKVLTTTEDFITLWGDGQEARDFLYIKDLCRIIELAIEKQGNKFDVFNCGSGVAMKIADAAQKIIDISGKLLKIEFDESKPTIKTSLCLDCTKAKNQLGWEPQYSFEDGMKETLAWYKENLRA